MSKQKRPKPKDKRDTKSWQRRNEARGAIQTAYQQRVAREQAEAEAVDTLLGKDI